MSESERAPEPVVGLLAEFGDADALKRAAVKMRDGGFARWDAHSPFPIHGIERAMGIRPTVLPWLVLGGGLAGAAAALVMQWWTNAIDYPLVLSGKPLFSLPANIPITFELIVLLSAFAAFFGALALNRLPQFWHFVQTGKAFRRATTDGFFISVEATDPKFDEAATAEMLRALGAGRVEICRDTPAESKLPGVLVATIAVVAVLALLPPLWIARARQVKSDRPRIHLVGDMDSQPKYKTQAQSAFFADHRTMRPPVPGTIAEYAPEDGPLTTGRVDGQWITELPIDVTAENMRRGRLQFDVYCATCHGLVGTGNGMTTVRARERDEGARGWVAPFSLQVPAVREQPVGQLYGTITDGIRTMPGYAAQILVEDRWRIVLYIRALQRSQNATIKDVPEEIRPQLR